MLENLFGHTWCDCLECDQSVEALRALMIGYGNPDDNLMIALVHFSHSAGTNPTRIDAYNHTNTTYHVFGELYYLLHVRGEIQDPQLVKSDEDDDEDWDVDDRV